MGETRDQHVRDQWYCMCCKLAKTEEKRDEKKVQSRKDLLGMLHVAQKYFNASFLWVEQLIKRGSLPLESSSLICTT